MSGLLLASLEAQASANIQLQPLACLLSFPTDNMIGPTTNDIFLGRGTLHAKHPGNTRFYQLVDGFLDRYGKADCKNEKTDLIKDIYDEVKASGQRFLKEDPPGSGSITEVSEDEAKKKIGHTIRYRQQRLDKKRKAAAAAAAVEAAGMSSSALSSSSQFTQARSITRGSSLPRAISTTTATVLPPTLVTPLASPTLPPASSKKEEDIFSDDELESVLGFPGQMDLSERPSIPAEMDLSEGPSTFFLQPSKKKISNEELGLGLAAFGFPF